MGARVQPRCFEGAIEKLVLSCEDTGRRGNKSGPVVALCAVPFEYVDNGREGIEAPELPLLLVRGSPDGGE